MKNMTLIIMITVVLTVSALFAMTGQGRSDFNSNKITALPHSDKIFTTVHAPIHIIGNNNFTSVNGVKTGGTGTQGNPYIIEKWDINATTVHGIMINDTNAYFVIQLCYVHSGLGAHQLGIALSNVTHGKIICNELSNDEDGVWLSKSPGNIVLNNNISSVPYGISLQLGSFNNTVSFNHLFNNYDGITLEQSDKNNITSNNIESNSNYGISVADSTINTIRSNSIKANGNVGIYVMTSTRDLIIDNNVTNNLVGLELLNIAKNNTIMNNTFFQNQGYGVEISASSKDARVYWNNFIYNNNSFVQASDDSNSSWNTSGEGNYWSDYQSRYPSATNNGIVWNKPYEINGTAKAMDHYPLVKKPNTVSWTISPMDVIAVTVLLIGTTTIILRKKRH